MLDPVVEIKSRLSIEDLVKDYVSLKRSGRNYKGLCPFHQEKTPSFMVSPDKGIAYCFGCHQGGDIFKFYMTAEKVDFGEAIHDLADRVGLSIDQKSAAYSSAQKDEKEKLRALLREAQSFFQKQTASSTTAQAYLSQRGISSSIIAQFGLGYAPDSWQLLHDHLLKSGFSLAEQLAAGVSIQGDKEPSGHDKFRDRIIFPFYGERGDVIGFTGRALTNENQPKYLNSPETVLFHKSSFIYGLYQAKSSIKAARRVHIVEGQVDCLTSVQAGILNTVAVSGTAFTPRHLEILRRQADTLIFIFDGDQAGKNAALRIMPDLVALPETQARFVLLGPDQDPDSLIRQDPALYMKQIEKHLDWFDYIMQAFFADKDLNFIEDQKDVLKVTIPLVKRLAHPLDQDIYVKKLADILHKSETLIYKTLQSHHVEQSLPTIPSSAQTDLLLVSLAFCVLYPQFIDALQDPGLIELLPADFRDIYRNGYEYYSTPRVSSDISLLTSQFPPQISSDQFSLQLLRTEEQCQDYDQDRLLAEKTKLFQRLKDHLKQEAIRNLQGALKKARVEGNKLEEQQILAATARILQLHT